MKSIQLLFLSVFFQLLDIPFCFSQQPDSLRNKTVYRTITYYLYEKDYYRGNDNFYNPDTTVNDVHKVNPALDFQHNYLGTAGSASEPKAFTFHTNPFTFTSIRSYDLNMLSPDSIGFFRTNKRYSEINYHSGNFKEQQISILHSQNITRLWNAGLFFDRQGVKDFMNFSDTFRSRFAFFSWYKPASHKYAFFASAIWNTLKNGVNGGLESDSLFDNTPVTNLGIKGLAYRISDAEQRTRSRIFSLSQYYYLSRNDSTINNGGNRLRFNLATILARKSFAYKDDTPDSSFYSDYYFSSSTYDSIRSDDLRNKISLMLPVKVLSSKINYSELNLFAGHQHVSYRHRTDSSWNNISVGASLNIKPDSSYSLLFAEADYIFSGLDEGNYSGHIELKTPDFNYGSFGLILMSSKKYADLVYRFYEGNNFLWRFDDQLPEKYFSVDFSFSLKKFDIYLNAGRKFLTDYVYFGNDAMPHQFFGKITVSQINLVKNFIYRNLHLDNSILYQEADKDGIIQIPSIVSDHSFYHEKKYFRNVLRAAFGLTISYSSSYYANAFMPATGIFYLQNTTKTGGYPRFDVFVNLKVKNARLFIKLENAGDNIYDRSYYLTPHYPMPGRVLKFGLNWRFFDQ